jgi:protein involved in polysaccharide export with SLBB domain
MKKAEINSEDAKTGSRDKPNPLLNTHRKSGKQEAEMGMQRNLCSSVSICGRLSRPWTLDFRLWTSRLVVAVGLLTAGSAWGAGAASTNAPAASRAAERIATAPAAPASSGTAAAFTNLMAGNLGGTNSSVDAAATMDTLDDKYHLAVGDQLSFRIREDEEDPKVLPVTDSGDLEVPYIGRFPAENKTCKELARELKKALEREYYYQATVILAVDSMTKSRGKVYLVGPVRVPGAQDIPSDEVLTLSKAIMRAGGFTDFADRRNVKVTRKAGPGVTDTRTFVVDVALILDKGKIERDLALEPGDLVVIPERLVRF